MSRKPLSRRATLLGAFVAVVLFAAGIYLGVQLAKPPPPPDFGGIRPGAPPPETPPAEPELPPSTPQVELEIRRQAPLPRGEKPRIALIVDDLGRSLRDLDTLAALGIPLTYSVLPFESKTPQVVRKLKRRGVEMICHLPMEAKGGNNPGEGAILFAMNREEKVEATRRALAAVGAARGVNNHMGSRVSADREAIAAVLEVLAEEGLYYVDSRTGPDTLGFSVARHLGIPAAERQVFLDDDRAPEKIREQFERLLAVAAERGDAIAIGHPYPETLAFLAAEVEPARERGFEFVTVSALLER